MLDLSYMFKDMTERNIQRTNPYSGQSEMLTKDEAELYDQIKQDEYLGLIVHLESPSWTRQV